MVLCSMPGFFLKKKKKYFCMRELKEENLMPRSPQCRKLLEHGSTQAVADAWSRLITWRAA